MTYLTYANDDRQIELNLRAERRECSKLFNAARRTILEVARRARLDDVDLSYAASPVRINQRFGGYNRDGRESVDLQMTVEELIIVANDLFLQDGIAKCVGETSNVDRSALKSAVATLRSFDVWYGSLCRRGFTPFSK